MDLVLLEQVDCAMNKQMKKNKSTSDLILEENAKFFHCALPIL